MWRTRKQLIDEQNRLRSELADMTRQRDEHAHNLRCAVDEVERMRRHARACAESMLEALDEAIEIDRHLGEARRVCDSLGDENRRLVRELDDMRRECDRAVQKHEKATETLAKQIRGTKVALGELERLTQALADLRRKVGEWEKLIAPYLVENGPTCNDECDGDGEDYCEEGRLGKDADKALAEMREEAGK